MRDPQTPADWQRAVDLAHAALTLEAARRLGVFDPGGPTVNTERAEHLLTQGAHRGYFPTLDNLEAVLVADGLATPVDESDPA
jgi:hypothetical protein